MKENIKNFLRFLEKWHIDIVFGILILLSTIIIPIILIVLFVFLAFNEMEIFICILNIKADKDISLSACLA